MPGRLFSLVGRRYEDGGTSGVPRFDFELRKVFPDIRSITSVPTDLDPDDVVITDNHMSVQVPQVVRTIGVHHGCAKTHWDREVNWRGTSTDRMVADQGKMFGFRNRFWVAPSSWVRKEFARHYSLNDQYALLLPHFSKPFGPTPRRRRSRPVVIGDWRDANKGYSIAKLLVERLPQFEFRQLSFKPGEHEAFYLDADLYLCLSLSEGAPYAVADAEACELPIVTTDVGWVEEFGGARVISWQSRNEIGYIGDTLSAALAAGRASQSYFKTWTHEAWSEAWRGAVGVVRETKRDSGFRVFPMPEKEKIPAAPTGFSRKPARFKPPPGQRIVVGLAGGLGNAIFNLPLIAALRKMGHVPIGYVETDYPSTELWRRCSYLQSVCEVPDQIPPAEFFMAGPWAPRLMHASPGTLRYAYRSDSTFETSEWNLIMGGARDLGWEGDPPDVSGWCSELDRSVRWDVGIATGCKPGQLWERKKYPHMDKVAARLLELGLRVAVFGTKRDPVTLGDDLRGKFATFELPDQLAGCRAFLGTDSGVTHLASSLGIPTAVLYTSTSDVKGDPVGPRNVKLSRKLPCSPCQSTERWNGCRDWICRDIPVELVVETVIGLLKEKP